tara:strand:+ start:272 stop:916 length:645 start_codon:yes stop_codon:yes gene_type:complete
MIDHSFLLALHSSSNILGIGILDFNDPKNSRRSKTFDIGRKLSNELISRVEEIIPSRNWDQIGRIAVSIGPGGFTGTRLTIAMARTLAQQLNCPLDGISSFALMAPRLASFLPENDRVKAFWIINNSYKKGIIGGKYKLKEKNNYQEVLELKPPNILDSSINISPCINATEDSSKDILRLLEVSLNLKNNNNNNQWINVLPIYPTSPVDNLKPI